jgi:DNA invertase Pin-like site-specific DNA recombinase
MRVSTEEQAVSGVSLDAQHERIRAHCTVAGLNLIKVIREEGVNASKALSSRPGGSDLVSVIASKQAEHIGALKLDRLFRDAEDALKQSKAWDRAGVTRHRLGSQALNAGSAMGRLPSALT